MKFILLILCWFIISHSFAQFINPNFRVIEPIKLVATYSLTYCEDTTNIERTSNQTMLLLIGNRVSCFLSKPYFVFDTSIRKLSSFEQFEAFVKSPDAPKVRLMYKIYKNYPEGKTTTIDQILPDTYRYEEDMAAFNWTLSGESDSINGFYAWKATCRYGGRNWTAWFTMDIAVSDGPYKFNGLPGLIIKVEDAYRYYVFQLISLEKPSNELLIDIEDKEYVFTTRQGFLKALESFRNDVINRVKEMGGSNNSQQAAAKNMMRKNNPIELFEK